MPQKLLFLLILFMWQFPGLHAQVEDLSQVWPSKWVAAANSSPKSYGVQHFRRTFDLEEVPANLLVHTSGDTRYQLFVNGQKVTWGPLTGDLRHWYYETTDIAPFLREGKNVIAADVLNYGSHPPDARLTVQTAFLLTADRKEFRYLNTGKEWKALPNQAYAPNRVVGEQVNGYYGGGSREAIDGRTYPWGWQEVDYDDAAWLPVEEVERAYAKGCRWASRWKLLPRSLPHERLLPGKFKDIRIEESLSFEGDFLNGSGKAKIAPGTRARMVLDWGHETTAYPKIVLSGGKDAKITCTYVEAPYIGTPKDKEKGDRNETEGKNFVGYFDSFIADGGEQRTFQPMWWRAFRYLEVLIETGEEALSLNEITAVHSSYPFEQKASVKVEKDEELDVKINQIMEIGHRTMLACSHEHFMDCPYYEESQFEGDTRIEALVSYYNYGDSSLGKQAIDQFSWSLNEEGFLSARYPTNSLYYIPNYSLFWIGMLHDYNLLFDDAEFVQEKLWVMRQVLSYFEKNTRSDGSLEPLDYHQFVDWSFPRGETPMDEKGYSALADLHYLMALQWAVGLEEQLGEDYFVKKYKGQAEKLKKSIRALYWNSELGLFTDTPSAEKLSQHANSLAILTGLTSGEEADAVMQKVLSRKDLTQATLYGSFYVFEAMAETGLAGQYLDNLDVWEEVMALNVTTWPETGPKSRSECHGWGASPNYHLLKTVAGIRPASSGFQSVEIRPNLGSIRKLSAAMPHSSGEIQVELEQKNGKLKGTVVLPEGISGSFIWKGKQIELLPGIQKISLP